MMTAGNSSPLARAASSAARARPRRPRPRRPPRAATGDRRTRQGRLRLAALVLARGRHELGQVLDAPLGFLAPLLAQVLQVAGLVEHLARWRSTPARARAISVSDSMRSRNARERRRRAAGEALRLEARGRGGPTATRRRAAGREPGVEPCGGIIAARGPLACRSAPARSASITPLPMPRAGTLMTRRRLTSSCGLRSSLR